MSRVVTLSAWLLRRTWFLLLFITLGMVAAVVIVGTIPLLSEVMTTAGLRNTLRSTPDSDELVIYAGDPGVATPIVQAAYNEFAPLFHRYLGNSVQQTQSSILATDFSFSPQRKNVNLVIYGTAMQQAATHFGKVDGRIVQTTNQPMRELEVMMTPATARQLGLHIGSTFSLSFSYFTDNPSNVDGELLLYTARIISHLVGLFQINSSNIAYWHGNNFNPLALAVEGASGQYQDTMVVSTDALLALFDHLRALHQADAVYSTSSAGYTFAWYYHFLPSHLTGSDLDGLISGITGLQFTMNSLYGDLQSISTNGTPTYPYLSSLGLSGSVLSSNGQAGSLEQLRARIDVARIPAGIFTILIVLLILFFVSLMTVLLVERQVDSIALLRSRGASGGQIFGSLFLQISILSLIALLVGIPLAIFITLLLGQHILASNDLDALNIITMNPWQAMLGAVPYALVVIVVVLITMAVSLFFAAHMDVLSLRRASARSSRRPLWQRLNLDVIAGVLALLGYGLSLYVTSVDSVLQADARALILTPLSIIAPFFLMLGCLLLFFRLFPLLLRWLARLAERGRGAVSVLALAQMTRSPRQSLRMAMLLALATSFALFTLVYSATQTQHIQDIANFQTGADFSAELHPSGNSSSLAPVILQYSGIAGVLAASAGYIGQGYGGHANLAMEIRAVDPTSFGHTVIWPSQQAEAQAQPLLAQLVSLRQLASSNNVVPALVDQTTLDTLLLHVGSTFTVKVNNVSPQEMPCLIIGVVEHIPTINTLTTSVTTGGVLVDYQTYFNVFTQQVKRTKTPQNSVVSPIPNHVWLHTKSDAASLESIRALLTQATPHLTNIVDRYLILSTLQGDPLYLILVGVLALGTITALLLALIGDILASWVSARTRVVSFASLRALGATLRQVALVFVVEQAIVYVTGLVLGAGFGTLLVLAVMPELTFTNINANLTNQQFFALQSALAARVVVPPSLLLGLLILLGICGMTLVAMVRIVTLPLLNQSLRLNED